MFGKKFGKIKNSNQLPPSMQYPMAGYPYPPQPVQQPVAQQPMPQQPMNAPQNVPVQQYPQQYPQPRPVMRPQVQGDLFKMEKITQNKKDWVVLEIVVNKKQANMLRMGKVLVVQ